MSDALLPLMIILMFVAISAFVAYDQGMFNNSNEDPVSDEDPESDDEEEEEDPTPDSTTPDSTTPDSTTPDSTTPSSSGDNSGDTGTCADGYRISEHAKTTACSGSSHTCDKGQKVLDDGNNPVRGRWDGGRELKVHTNTFKMYFIQAGGGNVSNPSCNARYMGVKISCTGEILTNACENDAARFYVGKRKFAGSGIWYFLYLEDQCDETCNTKYLVIDPDDDNKAKMVNKTTFDSTPRQYAYWRFKNVKTNCGSAWVSNWPNYGTYFLYTMSDSREHFSGPGYLHSFNQVGRKANPGQAEMMAWYYAALKCESSSDPPESRFDSRKMVFTV